MHGWHHDSASFDPRAKDEIESMSLFDSIAGTRKRSRGAPWQIFAGGD
jgi:hypothetical protein